MDKKTAIIIAAVLIAIIAAPFLLSLTSLRIIPLNSVDVFGGVWNLQPRMEKLRVGTNEQDVTTNAFGIGFDPDGELSGVITTLITDRYGIMEVKGAEPTINAYIGDVSPSPDTPAGRTSNGLVPAWYDFHIVVETDADWTYPTTGSGIRVDIPAVGEQPIMEWEEATVAVFFTVNLQETPLFTGNVTGTFEKVRIASVRTGMQPYPSDYDWVQIQGIVDDWFENSIEPRVDFVTVGGANIIDSVSEDTAYCHLTLQMRAGGEFTPSTWVSLWQRTANAKYTVHDVFAEFDLVVQLLIDDSTDGGDRPEVPWWESWLYALQDFIIKVQSGWERLAQQLGELLLLLIIGVFILFLIIICVFCRKGRKKR